MKRSLLLIGLFFLAGCCDFDCIDRNDVAECGNPCRGLRPLTYPVSTLMQAYGASAIGKVLLSTDRVYAAQAMQSVLQYGAPGETVEWQSPDGSASGRIKVCTARQCCIVSCQPIYCRRYRQEITVDDQTYVANGKACEDIYHVWRIVEEYPSPF